VSASGGARFSPRPSRPTEYADEDDDDESSEDARE
jgi:hypothetical protein